MKIFIVSQPSRETGRGTCLFNVTEICIDDGDDGSVCAFKGEMPISHAKNLAKEVVNTPQSEDEDTMVVFMPGVLGNYQKIYIGGHTPIGISSRPIKVVNRRNQIN